MTGGDRLPLLPHGRRGSGRVGEGRPIALDTPRPNSFLAGRRGKGCRVVAPSETPSANFRWRTALQSFTACLSHLPDHSHCQNVAAERGKRLKVSAVSQGILHEVLLLV